MGVFANMTASLNLNINNFASNLNKASGMLNTFAATYNGALVGDVPGSKKGAFKDPRRIVQGIIVSKIFYGAYQNIRNATSAVFEFSRELEKSHLIYKQFFGDTGLVKEFINVLKDFTAVTPFSFQEADKAARQLLAYGFEYKNLMFLMTGVMNAAVAMGDTSKIGTIVSALGQIQNKGRITGRELRRLAEANIPVFDILNEKLGVTQEQFQNIANEFIPAHLVINALIDGINERYGDLLWEMENTIDGLTERVKDNAIMIFSGLFEPVVQRYKNFLRNTANFLQELREAFQNFGVGGLFERLIPPELHAEVRRFILNLKELWSIIKVNAGSIGRLFVQVLLAILRTFNLLAPAINRVLAVFSQLFRMLTQNKKAMAILQGVLVGVCTAFALFKVRVVAAFVVAKLTTLITMLAKAFAFLSMAITKHPILTIITMIASALGIYSVYANDTASAIHRLTGVLMVAAAAWLIYRGALIAAMIAKKFMVLISILMQKLMKLGLMLKFVGQVFMMSAKAGAVFGGAMKALGLLIKAYPIAMLLILLALIGAVFGMFKGVGNLIGSITGKIGDFFKRIGQIGRMDPDKLLLPSQEDRAADLEKFNERLKESAENMKDLEDAANKAGRGLLSFDEVFKLNEDKGGMGLDGWDLDFPDLDWPDMGLPEIPDFGGYAFDFVQEFWDAIKEMFGKFDWKKIGLCALIAAALAYLFKKAIAGAIASALATLGIIAGALSLVWSITNILEEGLNLKNGLIGLLGGALAGAGIGWKIGGPKGALIGAVIGMGISLICMGVADMIFEDGLTVKNAIVSGLGTALMGAGIGFKFGGPKGALIGLAIGLVITLVASIAAAAGWESVSDWWEDWKLGMSVIGDWFSETFNTIILGIGWFFTTIIEAVIDFFSWFGELWLEGWEVIKTGVTTFFSDLGTAIADFFSQLWEDITTFWSDVWEGFTTWLSDLWESITTWIADTWEAFTTWTSDLWTNFTEFIADTWEAFTTWLSDLWESITAWIADTWTAFTTWMSNLWTSFTTWMSNLWTSFTTWLSNIWNAVVQFFSNIFNTVTQGLANIWNGFTSWLSNLASNIGNWGKDLIGRVGSFFSNLWGTISGWLSDIGSRVSNWWSSLWSGKSANVSVSASGMGGHAKGGVFNREHVARFAEGNKAEAIIPLENRSAMQPFVDAVGDGLYAALAPLFANMQGGGGNNLQPLYVGNLIADDRSLKELQRRMDVIQIQENMRKGIDTDE